MAKVGIIIRAKNEERWIGHCLEAVFAQDYNDFEVIIVDNESEDRTLDIAKSFPIAKVVTIRDFLPGKAINLGIEATDAEYIACLSAHCVPANEKWLEKLIGCMSEPNVAGAYGRQLPVSFSKPADKRDLLNMFGLDRRVQVKDSFFHNANSISARNILNKIPFDATVTNIEDRIWGDDVTKAGYNLVYEPEAPVYHYHGVHQGNDQQRLHGVFSVIESINAIPEDGLPKSMLPGQCEVAAVVPILGEVIDFEGRDLLGELVDSLISEPVVSRVYVLSELESVAEKFEGQGAHFIKRPPELATHEKSLNDAMQFALTKIEHSGYVPQIVLSLNYLEPFRTKNLFYDLIHEIQFKGFDTVFPGYRDFSNYWAHDVNGDYEPIGDHLKPLTERNPVYRALYGLGCASRAETVRKGSLIGKSVGILPVDNILNTATINNGKFALLQSFGRSNFADLLEQASQKPLARTTRDDI